MNVRKLFFSILFLIAGILILWYSFFHTAFEYHVVDGFADTTDNRIMQFMFVEVSKLDTIELKKLGQVLSNAQFSHNDSLDLQTDSLKVLWIQFYRLKDTANMQAKMRLKLQKSYPHIPNIDRKLNYFPKGYIYSGFSHPVDSLNVPQNKLIQSTIFAPKNSYKAKNILFKKAIPKSSNSKIDILNSNNEASKRVLDTTNSRPEGTDSLQKSPYSQKDKRK